MKRSKYVLIITLAIISVGNVPHLLFTELDGMFLCFWGDDFKQHLKLYELIWDTIISIFGNILTSSVCNLVCIIALWGPKIPSARESRSNIVQIFKRITIWSSVAFTMSVSPWIYCITINHGWTVLPSEVDKLALFRIADAILFLDNAANPLFYFFISKPFRTDIYSGIRRLRVAVGSKLPFLHTNAMAEEAETPHI